MTTSFAVTIHERFFVAGNWKMFKSPIEAMQYFEGDTLLDLPLDTVDVVLFVPDVYIYLLRRLAWQKGILLGAQDCSSEMEGPYTGEISPVMLRALGCDFVLAGHSERRRLFGETDDLIAQKTRAILGAGMTPVVCVGETAEERQAGQTFSTVERQLHAVLQVLNYDETNRILVAYEPVWAIGTGLNCSREDAEKVIYHLKELLYRLRYATEHFRTLYGGSVTRENVKEYAASNLIDGVLVGGASLHPKMFVDISVISRDARVALLSRTKRYPMEW